MLEGLLAVPRIVGSECLKVAVMSRRRAEESLLELQALDCLQEGLRIERLALCFVEEAEFHQREMMSPEDLQTVLQTKGSVSFEVAVKPQMRTVGKFAGPLTWLGGLRTTKKAEELLEKWAAEQPEPWLAAMKSADCQTTTPQLHQA